MLEFGMTNLQVDRISNDHNIIFLRILADHFVCSWVLHLNNLTLTQTGEDSSSLFSGSLIFTIGPSIFLTF